MSEASKAPAMITVVMEFTPSGYLKSVLLNATTDGAQDTLERALARLFKPGHLSWVRRLFTK